MITAPYNFVPLNEKVFYPPWSDDVSHDIPFKDSQSGVIDIKITAKSPIFIRNHYTKGDEYYEIVDEKDKDKKKKVSKEFCHFKKGNQREYYIPGSSVKGMIRNILEIMTFSKINIDEKKYKELSSVRDMLNQKLLSGTATGFGLLKFDDNGNAFLDDYGKPRTINVQEIKKAYKDYLFKGTVLDKYKKISPYSKIRISPYSKHMKSRNGKSIIKPDAKYDNNGQEAILFMTNHINNKKHEFVLLKSDIKEQNKEIANTVIKKFKAVYFSDGSAETHKLGAFWKKQLKTEDGKKYGIPVFYERDKNNKYITNIGLTQLFKIAYDKSILEASKQKDNPKKRDFAQTLFGTVNDGLELKGRVIFSHFKSSLTTFESKKGKEIVLGTPNPSYYPNYIMQHKENEYTTLMDKDSQITGWKRYPIQSSIQEYDLPKNKDGKINHDVTTKFKELDKGVTFKGKLIYHNLKKEELAALLSALTFHNNKTYIHNIGMAKPLGYGKIKLDISFPNIEEYMNLFEKTMNNWEEKDYSDWKTTPQVKELFSMSNENNAKNLRYQLLENPKSEYTYGKYNKIEKNEFVGAKRQKESLSFYSGEKYKQIQNRKEKTKYDKNKSPSANLMDAFNNR